MQIKYEEANDWDFSIEGKRQAKRMFELSEKIKKEGFNVIADFICPTPEARETFEADYSNLADTIKKVGFEDTNSLL